jgi:uncharacterized protein YukE
MGILGGILKCVTSSVDAVVGVLGKQQGIVQEMVQAPLQAIVGEVESGIWVGNGATAFIEECSGMFQPSAQSIVDVTGDMIGSITAALDTIEQADQKAAGLVNDLSDTFANIYRD